MQHQELSGVYRDFYEAWAAGPGAALAAVVRHNMRTALATAQTALGPEVYRDEDVAHTNPLIEYAKIQYRRGQVPAVVGIYVGQLRRFFAWCHQELGKAPFKLDVVIPVLRDNWASFDKLDFDGDALWAQLEPRLLKLPEPYATAISFLVLTGAPIRALATMQVDDLQVVKNAAGTRLRVLIRRYAGQDRGGIHVPVITPGARLIAAHIARTKPTRPLWRHVLRTPIQEYWAKVTASFGRWEGPEGFRRKFYVWHLHQAGLEGWERAVMLGAASDIPYDHEDLCTRIETYDAERVRKGLRYDHARVG